MNIFNRIKEDIFPIFQDVLPTATPKHLKLIPSEARQTGDYQVNGFLSWPDVKKSADKKRGLIIAFLKKVEEKNFPWLGEISSSEAGFINLKLSSCWLFRALLTRGEPLQPVAYPERVVVDYSAPNIAKEMAVHHMRSTFIGDAIARVLESLGHTVLRANHVGDWGTQFGLLLAWIKHERVDLKDCTLSDLEHLYCQAQMRKKEDPKFADAARAEVVALQKGERASLAHWQQLVDLSMARNYAIYRRLNVSLREEDTFGESFYNAALPGLIEDLITKGVAVKEEGMTVVFSEQFKNQNQQPLAIILQKSGGGFLYATTDLAALHYRILVLKADRIIYCVDARQAQHFELVWEVARRAAYLPKSSLVEHHAFGMMLGPDSKPYKTRSGATPKLMDLVDEAYRHAEVLLQDRSLELETPEERGELVRALAVNAIKYADLMRHRETNYKFSWEEALTLEGNSAPYLMYALVRARSILKKAQGLEHHLEWRGEDQAVCNTKISNDSLQRHLLLHLMRWPETVDKVAREGTPHLICHYLYQLALKFSSFYEEHPILTERDPSQFKIKIVLTEKMSQTLAQGLELLGLIPVTRM